MGKWDAREPQHMKTGIVIQCRMSSNRLPGKVLARVREKPMLQYLLDSLRQARHGLPVVIATSSEASDDPLADFCQENDLDCHRGPLEDVAGRFADVLRAFGFTAFVRLCGDSPLLDWRIMDAVLDLFAARPVDLATNVHPRSFPAGQSVEVVSSSAFLEAEARMTDPADREHVTRYFYRHASEYTIANYSSWLNFPCLRLSVDTPRDMQRFAYILERTKGAPWTMDATALSVLAAEHESTASHKNAPGRVSLAGKRMLRAGVIGLGVGAHHLRVFVEHPAVEIIGICDVNKERLSGISAEAGLGAGALPGCLFTHCAEDILLHPDIDLVSIASYDNYHHGQILAAFGAGKNVFVEKPLCMNREQAASIREALGEAELSSNMCLRTAPLFRQLKKTLASGDFGRVYHMEADYLWGRVEKLTNGWRGKLDNYSIVYGASVHMIDLVMWLTGKRPCTVSCYGNGIATAESGFRFNDFSCMILAFPDGMTCKIAAHGGCAHPHFHALKIFGTKKTFLHEGPQTYWAETSGFGVLPRLDAAYPAKGKRGDLLKGYIDYLLGAVDSPPVCAHEVFDCMDVCFAAEDSMKARCPVTITYSRN